MVQPGHVGGSQAQPASFATAGGDGEGSYSRNSQMANRLGACLQPSLRDALLHRFSPPHGAGPIHYADFGCAVGANTLSYAKFVVETLNLKPEMSGRDVVCHFVDLPSNDFNTLFSQLPPIVGQGGGDDGCHAEERTWFAAGVPGSQYSRVFPSSSLHIAISTLSLHYLPEIPKAVLNKSSPAYNKGYVGCHGASPAVAEAYAETLRSGLRKFFEHRAEELASGGLLAFFCSGRRDRAHPEIQFHDDSMHYIPDLEKAWRELVNEGVIAEELLDSFNIPACCPSVDEIQEAIDEHPTSAFRIQKLEYIDKFRPLPDDAEDTMFKDAESYGKVFTNLMKAGLGSMVTDHLGPELRDVLVERFRHNCEKDYPKWKAAHFPFHMGLCLAVLTRK